MARKTPTKAETDSWVIPFRCHRSFATALDRAAKRRKTTRNQLIVETLGESLGIPIPPPLPKGLAGSDKATKKRVADARRAAITVQG